MPAGKALELKLAQRRDTLAPARYGLLSDTQRARKRRLRAKVVDGVLGKHAPDSKVCLSLKSTGIPEPELRRILVMAKTKTKKTPARTRGVASGEKKAPNTKSEPPDDDPPDPRTVGGRVKICRLAKGIKKKADAARKLKMSAGAYGQLEAGDSKHPSAVTLLRMRDELHFNIDYVVKGEGVPIMPNFEERAQEEALLAVFRELKPDNRKTAFNVVQGIRRAQGSGPSPQDPFQHDPPSTDND